MKLVGAKFRTDKKQELWRRLSKRHCVCSDVQAGGELGEHLEGDPFRIPLAQGLCLGPSGRTAVWMMCECGFSRAGICPNVGHPVHRCFPSCCRDHWCMATLASLLNNIFQNQLPPPPAAEMFFLSHEDCIKQLCTLTIIRNS